MQKYLIVIERGESGYGAYSPDFPGCIATGKTVEETERRMIEALQGHLEYLEERGEPIPQPTTAAASFVFVAARSGASAA